MTMTKRTETTTMIGIGFYTGEMIVDGKTATRTTTASAMTMEEGPKRVACPKKAREKGRVGRVKALLFTPILPIPVSIIGCIDGMTVTTKIGPFSQDVAIC
jgi:hypothetical protein